MGPFRRVSSGFIARIDGLVRQIENHDALVEGTLRDLRRGAARARVSLARVRRDGAELRRRREQAEQERQAWKRRAVGCREIDEERALECLRRAKRAASDEEAYTQRLVEHDVREQRLADEVQALEGRVLALQARHHEMRTRAACHEGVAAVDGAAGGTARELESIFERWEEQLLMHEIGCAEGSDADPFAREFESAEELETLRAELAELEG